MALMSKRQIAEQVKVMLNWRAAEQPVLDELHDYLRNKQRHMWVPNTVPDEVRRIANMCRVNVLGLVIDSVAQSMYVDGYRADTGTEAPAWDIWQRNKLDARQVGIHRAMLTYGVSYTTVLPGAPVAVIRGQSPRYLTAVYGEDDDWPMWALEKRRSATRGETLYRLFDDKYAYWVTADSAQNVEYVSHEEHGVGRVPVVRYLNKADLDDEVISDLDDLMNIQDQINFTTFGLLVCQHYGAHAQKWIAGWLAESTEEYLKATAAKVWTFEDPETKFGQFEPATLDGYIESRKDSLRNLAAISQTPAHALRGELVNLSAEALAAAEQSERRKITEKETMAGESWEQSLELAAEIDGLQSDPSAQVRWRDTEARAFAATVDALGKMVQMLGIPPEEVWEKVPGVTQQDVERWRASLDEVDSFARLEQMLARQGASAVEAE